VQNAADTRCDRHASRIRGPAVGAGPAHLQCMVPCGGPKDSW
jgi:hypothetical protein